MRTRIALPALAALTLVGCPDATMNNRPLVVKSAAREPAMTALRSAPASDGRLEIQLEIAAGVALDRVPLRTAVLHFKNVSGQPLRIYLPTGEPFRASISTLSFAPAGAPPLFEPEPHPHGCVITEQDFPLIAPGASVSFTQRFTIDPVAPGVGNTTHRRPGFEPGKLVPVSWTYQNAITQWKGGAQTLDGPTRELFGGKTIPFLWTGKLSVRATWIAPPH
jgi:hypothetical protein